MKINNETKIGIIAIAALIMLFLGFSYLKGKSLFHTETRMYAVYHDVMGLKKSNPVIINGLQVGTITDIDGGANMRDLLVTFTFSKNVNIPDNSVAVINPNLLGSPTLEIQLGSSNIYKKNGDTIMTTASTGAIDEALKVLNPVLYEVRNAVQSLDSVLLIISSTFDADTKKNIKDIISNMNLVSQSINNSAKSLETMMNPQTGVIGQSLNNINSFTGNLSRNNQKIDSILGNVNLATNKFSQMDINQTLDSLNMVINNLKNISDKINTNQGSLGLLIGDKTIYNNLESTTQKLNTLLDDMRVHPRRYVNFSVFGKKDKGNYLMAPIADDTLILANPKK